MSSIARLAFAGVLALTAGLAGASDPPQSTIQTRQAGFKKMGAAMKLIVAQLKTDAPDTAQIAAATQVIRSGAEAALQWFPTGSGPDAGSDTDALAYIWQERAKFDALANRLVTESKTLTAAASANDVAALRSQVKAVGEICSTCHHSFRAD
jgi:cytochrome c556